MAFSQPILEVSYKAYTDLSSYQYCFVKETDADTVTVAGNNERSIGILQNKPTAAGREAVVMVLGLSLLKVNEPIAIGKMITPYTGGLGEIADAAGEWVNAIAKEAATAQNDIITVLLAHFDAHESDA